MVNGREKTPRPGSSEPTLANTHMSWDKRKHEQHKYVMVLNLIDTTQKKRERKKTESVLLLSDTHAPYKMYTLRISAHIHAELFSPSEIIQNYPDVMRR